jgi:hypothetical protein
VPCGEPCKLLTVTCENCIFTDHKAAHTQLRQLCKDAIEVPLAARIRDM